MGKLLDFMFKVRPDRASLPVFSAQDERLNRLARDLCCSPESLSFLLGSPKVPESELTIPRYG